MGQRTVELTQHDADAGVGVAGEQCRMQIELIVARHGDDRFRGVNTSPFQRIAVMRQSANQLGADRRHRAGKLLIRGAQNGHLMTGQSADFRGRAERQRIVAEDEGQNLVGGAARPAHASSPDRGG